MVFGEGGLFSGGGIDSSVCTVIRVDQHRQERSRRLDRHCGVLTEVSEGRSSAVGGCLALAA